MKLTTFAALTATLFKIYHLFIYPGLITKGIQCFLENKGGQINFRGEKSFHEGYIAFAIYKFNA